jgi:DNA-binding CsgD family transcriptional regulator
MVLEHEVGNEIEGNGYLEQLVESLRLVTPGATYDYASVASYLPVVARITGMVDQLHIAESAAAAVLSAEFATPFVSRYARLGLGVMAVVRGDVEAAREQYASLGKATGTYSLISGDRVLGLLAQTIGDLDQAVTHFEDALTFSRTAGYMPELAWSCHDYAGLLLERNETEDRAKAMDLLNESISTSGELGMRPLSERSAALLQKAESVPAPPPANPGGLTQREVEVIRLVAAGRTDREIAEELIIGLRTASTHVRNILNKTGASNRAEAASWATREGLD